MPRVALIAGLHVIWTGGCDMTPRSSVPDLAIPPRSVTVVRPAVDAAAGALVRPKLVEVELRGKVEATGAPAGPLVVVVTDGPCFAPGSHYVGSMPARAGKPWFVEVFPPEGTRLEVCAAVAPGGRRLTPWYGRAPKSPLLAKGTGEVEFGGIDVRVTKQRPIQLPPDLKIE